MCVAGTIAAALVAAPARAQAMDVTFSLPATTFSFMPVYVAEAQDSWAERNPRDASVLLETRIPNMDAASPNRSAFPKRASRTHGI
jgi:hypothetical protein